MLINNAATELWKIKILITETMMIEIKPINKVLLQVVKSFLVKNPKAAETMNIIEVTAND